LRPELVRRLHPGDRCGQFSTEPRADHDRQIAGDRPRDAARHRGIDERAACASDIFGKHSGRSRHARTHLDDERARR